MILAHLLVKWGNYWFVAGTCQQALPLVFRLKASSLKFEFPLEASPHSSWAVSWIEMQTATEMHQLLCPQVLLQLLIPLGPSSSCFFLPHLHTPFPAAVHTHTHTL